MTVPNETPVAVDAADDAAFGFWLSLMSDAILFGLLFATYAVMVGNTAGGPGGAALFSLRNLSWQTACLLTSTLTMAFATAAAGNGALRRSVLWLGVTAALGAGFLVLELQELGGLIAAGHGPARSGFLSAFFTLVGTHGLHVAAGLIWTSVIVVQLLVKGPHPKVMSRLHRLGLFWHFLDIVWIGVLSEVYLAGMVA